MLPVLLPVSLLMVPVADLVLAVVRRTRAGRSPFAPDKQHLHHRLLEIGHSQRRAVYIMWMWAALVAGGSVLVSLDSGRPTWVGLAAMFVFAAVHDLRAADRPQARFEQGRVRVPRRRLCDSFHERSRSPEPSGSGHRSLTLHRTAADMTTESKQDTRPGVTVLLGAAIAGAAVVALLGGGRRITGGADAAVGDRCRWRPGSGHLLLRHGVLCTSWPA